MVIDRVYRLVQAISNKEQRGNIPPAQFNLFAEMAQIEFINKRINVYELAWRIHEDLRPLVYGPVTIPIESNGNFNYPYGYIFPDAIHKNDFTEIKRITADQYPRIKKSSIIPPTPDYPIIIFRHPYGYIDPYSIGSFGMSFVKSPPIPVWGYGMLNESPVFDANLSVDFTIPPRCYTELVAMILQHVGINLSVPEITQFAMAQEATRS